MRKLLKQQQEFNADDASERLFITARDGEQVPVSLVYRRDLFKGDGSNPLLQYGYGAMALPSIQFSSTIPSLPDRGFVYAITHIRGQRCWVSNGMKQASSHKQNSFNDFIDVTEALLPGYVRG